MQKLVTLEKVFDRVDKMSAQCHDHHVDVKDIDFESLDSIRLSGTPHPVRPVAQRSFANRLGIPFPYLRRCPEEIQAANLNHWINQEKNDQLFIRFDGDEIRAVFTPKYTPVDNFEILERLDSLGYGPDTKVQCSLDAEFLSLSIPDGRKAFDINGDRFKPGISISNSEVGLASLTISAFVLRLVCTNGLIARTGISASYRHVSTRILKEFPQTIETVSKELGAQQRQFRISMEAPVDNPMQTMDSFNRQFAVSAQEKEAVDWGWSQESGKTMFNIIQAYTRAAQMEGLPAESSYRLQRIGGDILDMVT
ncbi:DUF932 domain-containing protein [Desulfosudis oleivorans]|uniref:DUF932 domain-containing protein n=1 Tax=Desulfosudis oleivorans (strain DSM 6200 / JCM 39069 / Hxd3) TaxID=96561 RepID=A8ZYJ5_DESOH|nr:DUF932 domain-containing protein [Desulfosudis oleivorans]ABW68720.1 hypothetical protein Dole_2917 [Desulfosudis oleivorans Hxd3]